MNDELKINSEMNTETYWNHNTVYHKWILSHIKTKDKVLDVGCGDGLLVYRLSKICERATGIDTHSLSIKKAEQRLIHTENASVINIKFEDFKQEPSSFNAIIFVASLHHMDTNFCIRKAVELLAPNGKLLVVGLARPSNIIDWIVEMIRLLPAKIGDLFHKATPDIGVPIKDVKESLKEVKRVVNKELPNAKIKRGLYYRYLLTWTKPTV